MAFAAGTTGVDTTGAAGFGVEASGCIADVGRGTVSIGKVVDTLKKTRKYCRTLRGRRCNDIIVLIIYSVRFPKDFEYSNDTLRITDGHLTTHYIINYGTTGCIQLFCSSTTVPGLGSLATGSVD